MKTFIVFILISLVFLCPETVFSQRKSKRPVKTVGKPYKTVKPKIEAELWKEFDAEDLKIKVSFPKDPTRSAGIMAELDPEVLKSSIIQTFINGNFYMVEVREYPKNFLPQRNDLGANYGIWLKEYIFTDNKMLSEKIFDLGSIKAVEFIYQETDRDVLIHRAFVFDQKLIQMIMQMELKKTETREQLIEKNKEKIGKFFDSFEISEQIIPNSITGKK